MHWPTDWIPTSLQRRFQATETIAYPLYVEAHPQTRDEQRLPVQTPSLRELIAFTKKAGFHSNNCFT